jgi:CBS domain containing-hemolysin-like protein
MASTGLTRFPVVARGAGRRLVGMIALSDLLAGRSRTLDAEERRERVFSLTLGRRAG